MDLLSWILRVSESRVKRVGGANAAVVLPILMISNIYVYLLRRRWSGDDTPVADPFAAYDDVRQTLKMRKVVVVATSCCVFG